MLIPRIKIMFRDHLACWLLYMFVSSVFGGLIALNQGILESLFASRHLLLYLFIYIIIVNILSIKDIYTLTPSMLLILMMCSFINIVPFFLNDFSMFIDALGIKERLGQTRFLIAGSTMMVLFIYFLVLAEKKVIFLIPVLIIFFICFVIGKGRAIAAPQIILLFIYLWRMGIGSILFSVFITFILIIFYLFDGLSNLSIYFALFNEMIEYTAEDISKGDSGNILYRVVTILYYLDQMTAYSHIFGVGHESSVIYPENLYLSDTGIFSIYFYYGITGIILFLLVLKKLWFIKIDPNFDLFCKYFCMYIFLTPSLSLQTHLVGIITLSILFQVIKQHEKKYN